jgi:hypothetical protein
MPRLQQGRLSEEQMPPSTKTPRLLDGQWSTAQMSPSTKTPRLLDGQWSTAQMPPSQTCRSFTMVSRAVAKCPLHRHAEASRWSVVQWPNAPSTRTPRFLNGQWSKAQMPPSTKTPRLLDGQWSTAQMPPSQTCRSFTMVSRAVAKCPLHTWRGIGGGERSGEAALTPTCRTSPTK